MSSKLRLRPLALSDEATVRTAQRELAEDDFEFTFDLNDTTVWSEYLRTLDERRRNLNVLPDRVPSTFLVAVVDGEIVGRTSIRHELNAWLAERGGHIGYGIRPGFSTPRLRDRDAPSKPDHRVCVGNRTGTDHV
jgi:predicted acetyltransferase